MERAKQMLGDLVAWGADLEGFTAGQAADALTLAKGYVEGFEGEDGKRVEGIGVKDERTTLLLAMDVAWLFWLDDRLDARGAREVRGERGARGAQGACAAVETEWTSPSRPARDPSRIPEIYGIALLCPELERRAQDPAMYRLWFDEAINVIRAYYENNRFSRGDRAWTYAEYLQNGELSVGVMHCVATISLLYGLDMPARLRDRRFQRMMRNLCLAMRLQNDLVSARKERVEGDRANALFFMEELVSPQQALAFVVDQQKGYERLLSQDLAALGPADPFTRIAQVMLSMTARFYSLARARYSVQRRLTPPLGGMAISPNASQLSV